MKWLNRGRDSVWLAAALAGSAILQFATIGWRTVWHDESFTALLISYDYGELLRRAALDVHPPLYYLVLKPWSGLFGTSEAALRSLSAVCMLGTVLMAFMLIRKLFGSLAARFALPFLVLGPFIVRYGMEARMYGLAALLMMSATYVLVRLMRDKLSRPQLWWLAYVLLMSALLYTHYFAGLIIPVHWLFVWQETRRRHPKSSWKQAIGKFGKSWWLVNAAIVALFLPWLPTFLTQAGEVNGGFWIGSVTLRTLPETATTVLLLRGMWLLPPLVKWLFFAWLIWFMAAAVMVYRRANRTDRNSLTLLVGYLMVPALILYAVSASPLVSVYYVRYFALFTAGLYAFIGAVSYLNLKHRGSLANWLLTLVTLGVLASGVASVYLPGQFNDIRNDNFTMKSLIKQIDAKGEAGDIIVASDLGVYFDLRFYNPTNQIVRVHNDTPPRPYGNWSLVYDRPEVMLYDYGEVSPPSGYVWYVTGKDQELPELPENWQAATPVIESGYAKIIRYQVKQ